MNRSALPKARIDCGTKIMGTSLLLINEVYFGFLLFFFDKSDFPLTVSQSFGVIGPMTLELNQESMYWANCIINLGILR